jgi:hypothetical protein
MDKAFITSIKTTQNPFLFPAEAVFLYAVRDILITRQCAHAAKFLEVIMSCTYFRRDFVVRQWLGHGLLDLKYLLESQGTYAPTGIVSFAE